jgi:acyl-CoA hydrolase
MRIAETVVESVERIQPNQANNYENVHGGEMVRLMDELAAIAAMEVAGVTCVTAHISSVDFREPVPVGHVAELTSYVYDTGETSLDIYVSVDHRNPRTRSLSRATEACFVYVAVDENDLPQPVPDVVATEPEDDDLLAEVPC